VDPTVTANTTLYSVFKTTGGQRTYVATNPAINRTPMWVGFSDGTTLAVPSGYTAWTGAVKGSINDVIVPPA
jgi:hypothetical protein